MREYNFFLKTPLHASSNPASHTKKSTLFLVFEVDLMARFNLAANGVSKKIDGSRLEVDRYALDSYRCSSRAAIHNDV